MLSSEYLKKTTKVGGCYFIFDVYLLHLCYLLAKLWVEFRKFKWQVHLTWLAITKNKTFAIHQRYAKKGNVENNKHGYRWPVLQSAGVSKSRALRFHIRTRFHNINSSMTGFPTNLERSRSLLACSIMSHPHFWLTMGHHPTKLQVLVLPSHSADSPLRSESWLAGFIQTNPVCYCWWKNSCTSWIGEKTVIS